MTDAPAEEHHWYASESPSSLRVLEALREYDAAFRAMERRTQVLLGVGATDLAALRFVLSAQDEERVVVARDIAAHLGLSRSAVTDVLDRLTVAGHLARVLHPRDRRSLAVVITPSAAGLVGATLTDLDRQLAGVVSGLTAAEADVVMTFLQCMTVAVSEIDT
ncbi:MarR family winged helix-turn-helix transcriptional regulator [Desertivibrio insolitus]|uniref:MarR family winged helix-turn-helix transcriptional regulator n=1 Tax=Herbiconiux sp. SYSU D00978 TaxID=2812562 RepID=UPI001A961150|nr:MarR family transcriptional regulator [Herbiconiux sp. SYSU D00978]